MNFAAVSRLKCSWLCSESDTITSTRNFNGENFRHVNILGNFGIRKQLSIVLRTT